MKTKITLGKSVSKLVWGSVSYSVCDSVNISGYNSVRRSVSYSVWGPIRNLTRWNISV